MRWPQNIGRAILIGIALFTSVVLLFACVGPMATAIEIGLDEHYELSKALLWARGYALYDPIWSDQPPLLTVILGWAFRLFGESIAVARAVAGLFGISLIAAFFLIGLRRAGLLAALLAVGLLLVSPQVLWLSVSTMQEVPAIGTALWALWAAIKWTEDRRSRWLALAGFLLAIALQIKLTAIVVAPAIAAEIMLGVSGQSLKDRCYRTLISCGVCGVATLVTLLILVFLWGTTPLDILAGSHFSGQAANTLGVRASGVAFVPMLIKQHPEMVGLAPLGIALVVINRDYRQLSSGLILLTTVTLLYAIHRPFWEYYYLHVAIPLAWLGGYGLARTLFFMRSYPRGAWRTYIAWGLTALLIILVAFFSRGRLNYIFPDLWRLPKVSESSLISNMKAAADQSSLIYTRHTIYAFHAGIPVVPEFAVLPLKRFATGQIDERDILKALENYRPEFLLFANRDIPRIREMTETIDEAYEPTFSDGEFTLFVERDASR